MTYFMLILLKRKKEKNQAWSVTGSPDMLTVIKRADMREGKETREKVNAQN